MAVTLVSVVVLSVALFVSTNVDDLFVLAAFFADTRTRARDVVAGQILGISALTVGSFVLSLAAVVIPARWIGWLGLVPLALGLRMAWRARRRRERDDTPTPRRETSAGMLSIAAVTMANGADNVTAYVPLFAGRKHWESAVTMVVFGVMTVLWCVLAHRLVHHPKLGAPIRRYGDRVLPVVLVALGVWLFVDAGAYRVVLDAIR